MDSPLDIVFNQLTYKWAPCLVFLCAFSILRRKNFDQRLGASLLFFVSAVLFFTVGTVL